MKVKEMCCTDVEEACDEGENGVTGSHNVQGEWGLASSKGCQTSKWTSLLTGVTRRNSICNNLCMLSNRSLSFVLVTSCMAFFLLSVCYLLVDIVGWWNGAPFFYPGRRRSFGTHVLFFQVFNFKSSSKILSRDASKREPSSNGSVDISQKINFFTI